ncbi:MAG: bifunctional riboflavin kinase/FAD synthetase [Ferruginibacter sp.]|nr:bifunctional riboflavin kinase/FAD synthetase [Cytophagales bacterium]
MKVYQGLDAFQRLPLAVVTSGTFDGVHVGHQKILSRLHEASRQYRGESVVITYWPHPRLVVSDSSQDLKLLSTIDERIETLAGLRIDHLLIIPFTRDFSQLSSEEFVSRILVEIGTKRLIIGHDHRFGRNREGSFESLRDHASRYGMDVEEIPRQDIEAVGVSSTRIRNALLEGNVTVASQHLGRPYCLKGVVMKGNQLGRTIGFPTANVQVPEPYKLIPADGVYAVRVAYQDQLYDGMLNIGVRPTVSGTTRTTEAHLFDFDREIYGQEVTVYLVDRLRDERKFAGLPELKEQLANDRQRAKSVLGGE